MAPTQNPNLVGKQPAYLQAMQSKQDRVDKRGRSEMNEQVLHSLAKGGSGCESLNQAKVDCSVK